MMKTNKACALPLPSKAVTTKFRSRLLTWYHNFGRHDLPWQVPNNPYYCWLSEIMLQQTQVQSVRAYFVRFIERFPTVEHLAKAPLDAVLSLWSGLGYYARARNLHAAAKQIMSVHKGQFPTELDALAELPGIGPSTAAAIRSQAFQLPAAILDGNVKRVLSRFAAVDAPINSTHGTKMLWSLADHLACPEYPGHYTQAIMDLGAMVCTRTKPDCAQCPVSHHCAAHQQGTTQNFPVKVKKKPIPETQTAFALYHCTQTDRVLLYRRIESGLWGGLWCLPEPSVLPQGQVFLQKKHRFTHFVLNYTASAVARKTESVPKGLDGTEFSWFPLPEALELGIPKPIRDILIAYRGYCVHQNGILSETKETC